MAHRTLPPSAENSLRPLGFRVWPVYGLKSMASAHTHADIELNFVRSGSLRYRHGGIDVSLGAGDLGVFWGGVPHQLLLSPGQKIKGTWATVPIAWLLRWHLPGNMVERLLAGEFLIVSGKETPFTRWEEDCASEQPSRQRVLQLELEAMLHRVGLLPGGRTMRKKSRKGSGNVATGGLRIEQVATYLATHYHESLSLAKIAQRVGVHPKYLARIFKAHCGLAVWDYLTRLRVAHAQRLLVTTELKTIDVALESGFGSVAPFYAAFARHGNGRTPREFRNEAMGNPTAKVAV